MSAVRTSAISRVFAEARDSGRSVLIPYCMGGYPSFDESAELIVALAEAGADIVEIGIPFSDPLADGPTIQTASQTSLEAGFRPEHALELAARVSDQTDVPLVFMTYYNIVLHFGLKRFAREAAKVGVAGVILPDLPPDEAGPWHEAAQGKLDTIYLLAPTSAPERIKSVAKVAEGFIYAVSTVGVTGARTDLSDELSDFVGRIRATSDKPIAVGFGVSTASQAATVAKIADGVIIGSALIDRIARAKPSEGVDAAVTFISAVREALDHP